MKPLMAIRTRRKPPKNKAEMESHEEQPGKRNQQRDGGQPDGQNASPLAQAPNSVTRHGGDKREKQEEHGPHHPNQNSHT